MKNRFFVLSKARVDSIFLSRLTDTVTDTGQRHVQPFSMDEETGPHHRGRGAHDHREDGRHLGRANREDLSPPD
ncbi:hypothetical protein WKW80_09050 [Variovorax humicola]|uniref:Uncharacterized protein n=1 Tax=Variovorax humicola TaxID=1769758 RepID=A0ABU8VWJ4_9BURK